MNRLRAIWREEEKKREREKWEREREGRSHESSTMPVKKQGDGGDQQQQLDRFDPEAEEKNEPEDLQETTV